MYFLNWMLKALYLFFLLLLIFFLYDSLGYFVIEL